jgi:hypothetical protein
MQTLRAFNEAYPGICGTPRQETTVEHMKPAHVHSPRTWSCWFGATICDVCGVSFSGAGARRSCAGLNRDFFNLQRNQAELPVVQQNRYGISPRLMALLPL